MGYGSSFLDGEPLSLTHTPAIRRMLLHVKGMGSPGSLNQSVIKLWAAGTEEIQFIDPGIEN